MVYWGDQITERIELQDETRLQALRRVLLEAEDARVFVSSKDIDRAKRAGRREAEEASRKSGVDYTSAYERMCQRMAEGVR